MTEGHEVWTQQVGWTSACQLSVGDAFIDAAGEPVEIVEIVFDPTPTTVYNLEVDGAFTYFAEGVWVHNDSCTLSRMGRVWNNYGHSFEYAVRQMHYLPVYTGPKLRGGWNKLRS